MDYIFKGSLASLIWDDYREPLPKVKVKLYDVNRKSNLNDLLTTGEKRILITDTVSTVRQKKRLLFGEGETDHNGNFEIRLKHHKYHGEAFEVAIAVESIAGSDKKVHEPVEFVVATFRPLWPILNNKREFEWNYALPFSFWRYILNLFDVWVIYGKVVLANHPEIPIVGTEVTAKDACWICDHILGKSITNKQGYFKLYYAGSDFMPQVAFSDNQEKNFYTDIYGGPDVFFTVKSANGTTLIDETREDGRKPDRSNIGNCYCITLSFAGAREMNLDGMDSVWTGIGSSFTIPAGDDLNDFDASGYAGIMRYAFSGKIRLTGRKVNKVGPHSIEYRFLVSKNAGVNGGSVLPSTKFSFVVGRDSGLFAETRIGQMWQFAPTFKIVNIYAKEEDLDAEGWLDPNRPVERAFHADPALDATELNTPGLWKWVDSDAMIGLNTEVLTSHKNHLLPELRPGDDILSSERLPVEKIAIRFEIREVIDRSKHIYNYLPGHGKTLNSMVVNNSNSIKLLGIKEQQEGANPHSSNINVVYTAYHSHLRDVSINIRKKNETSWHGLSDLTVPLACNNNPAITVCHNQQGISIPENLLATNGTYIVMMFITRRLHNGEEPAATEWVEISFTYQNQLTDGHTVKENLEAIMVQ